jgi:hypothetical protein
VEGNATMCTVTSRQRTTSADDVQVDDDVETTVTP